MEKIKRIHFNILTEIVQATTLCNVQEAKGVGSIDSIDQAGFSQKEKEHWLGEQNDNVKSPVQHLKFQYIHF